jgi:hypothetical protein
LNHGKCAASRDYKLCSGVLLLALPLSAQDEWPEGCELPDLEAAFGAANDAQAEGDVTALWIP